MKFLLWCILLVLCWPVAIGLLFLCPLLWLILLPFKLAGGVIHLVFHLFALPFKILKWAL
jgi:hypothetical protein